MRCAPRSRSSSRRPTRSSGLPCAVTGAVGQRRPGVDTRRMLTDLARGIDAIEASQRAKHNRHADVKRYAWAQYQRAQAKIRAELDQEAPDRGPSLVVAALFGADAYAGRPHIF